MRNPTLLLLSLALSIQLTSAVPVPTEELAPIGSVVKSTAATLQQTTARLSTGMAGGMAGMSGVAGLAGVAGPGGSLRKRLIPSSLNLGFAGLNVIKDPTTALDKLPFKTLKKRLLPGGGLTGILGLLKTLQPKPAEAPPQALPVLNPTKVKDKETDSEDSIDDPQKTGSEEFPSDLDPVLDGTSAARNGSTPTNSSVNETINSNEEETPAPEPLTSRAASKRFLEDLMPKEKMHREGYSDPEKVLEELGANDVIKTVIDAPDITGVKDKRVDVGGLGSLGTTLDSAANLMKAMPLSQAQQVG